MKCRWKNPAFCMAVLIPACLLSGSMLGCTPELEQSPGQLLGAFASGHVEQWLAFGLDMLRALLAAFVL